MGFLSTVIAFGFIISPISAAFSSGAAGYRQSFGDTRGHSALQWNLTVDAPGTEGRRRWIWSTGLFIAAVSLFLLASLLLFALPVANGVPQRAGPLALCFFVLYPAAVISAVLSIERVRESLLLTLPLTVVAYFVGMWLFLVIAMSLGRITP